MTDQGQGNTALRGTPAIDVEMTGAGGGGEHADEKGHDHAVGVEVNHEGDDTVQMELKTPGIIKFLDYLKSPIVELLIGREEEEQTRLTAHQALLIKSPFFEQRCAHFATSDVHRRINLPDEDLDAMGSLLEYLYHGEYFPKRLSGDKGSKLEPDPTAPETDVEGTSLLRHARVYTLADKFGLPELKELAHSKIHRTESTATGEIAYARYVYANAAPDDHAIRRPVAVFWAQRSHVLRRQAEHDFRRMCLDHPQFGLDVLTLVLDARDRRGQRAESAALAAVGGTEPVVGIGSEVPRSAKKRARVSHG